MDKLRVNILVDGEHKLGDNSYVLGKISGFKDCICKTYKDMHFANRDLGFGVVLKSYCTSEEYVELKSTIEDHYPGLCKFGIEVMDVKK